MMMLTCRTSNLFCSRKQASTYRCHAEGMLGGARNLPFTPAPLFAYGMKPKLAIRAITLNPAKAGH